MYLERILLTNFKNIAQAEVPFSPKINCITGENGAGKTNLLEAVHYLSMTKSFLPITDRFVCRFGTDSCALHGVYRKDGQEERIAVSLKPDGEKTVRRNGKNYVRISDHIGFLPVVAVSPSDISLVHDSGEERRRLMNMVLSQTDPEYLRAVKAYNRALLQRNRVLKQDRPDPGLLDAFTAMLVQYGEPVHRKRAELARELDRLTEIHYRHLSGGRERVEIAYASDLNGGNFADLLESVRERDRLLRFTTVGVQRDDLQFSMDGHPIRKSASQGQQKTFLTALKLAQFELMRSIYGYRPILLLDDVFDKLDMSRVGWLVELVAREDFGQIFLTDSNKVRLEGLVAEITGEHAFFQVRDGEVLPG